MYAKKEVTQIHRTIEARNFKPVSMSDVRKNNLLRTANDSFNYASLVRNLGIDLPYEQVHDMLNFLNAKKGSYGMDALQPTVTTGSVITPIQFLQEWLPGFIEIITQARKIDELVGMSTAGDWELEQVIFADRELTGLAQPYGDFANVPFANWNLNFNSRTIVRFEQGMQVRTLEEARAARINVNSGAAKRESCSLALEIVRNLVGFYGYNNGANQTYGFLNDPNLPAYVPFAVGASTDTEWSTKTFLEITKDIRTMMAALRTQSGDNINPRDVKTTLALASDVVDYMTTTTDFNISVEEWLQKNYPNCRVVSAPELNGANGGANVAYLYADKVNDSSTDGGKVFDQVVPTKFRVLGVAKLTKGYEEDYANSTAGILLKRPWAVVRYSGC